MPMIPFYTRYPDLAFQEMRSIIVRGRDDLPNGQYGFLELYCDEVDCDCRRVIIHVVSPDTGSKIWATINYGWESVAFYARWMRNAESAVECKGPSLDPLNPQTAYSPALLHTFEFVLQDETYVKRLKRHYELFKTAIKEEPQSRSPRKGQRRQFRRRKKP